MIPCAAVARASKSLKNADLDKIADQLRHGVTAEEIGRLAGLSRRQVDYRVAAMRQRLAKATADVRWLDANPVAVGRGWHAEPVSEDLTAPSESLAGRD